MNNNNSLTLFIGLTAWSTVGYGIFNSISALVGGFCFGIIFHFYIQAINIITQRKEVNDELRRNN